MIGGMDMPASPQPRKGRGAASNASGRFESEERVAFDDGWSVPGAEPEPMPLDTVLSVDATRTIIARNNSPDIGFDRSINPYRGCEHGCIYCYRAAEPRLSRPVARPRFRDPHLLQAAGGGAARPPSCARRAIPAGRSRSAATPTPTSRPSASSASRARSSKCCAISAIR